MSVKILEGDCRDVIKTIADNSIDSVVTDPPYALVSIVKRFGKSGSAAVKVPEGGTGAYARASKGFMGKEWDTGETAFSTEFWAEIFRVLKPGGHVVSFSGTRTYHRMACAIEDAGFEIRDQIGWLYGCLDDQTSVATEGGVKQYHKTIVGERVLCYDISSGGYSYQPILERVEYDYDDIAYRVISGAGEQLVSRNHRVIVERDGVESFAYAETCEQAESLPFLESLHDLHEAVFLLDQRTGDAEQDLREGVSESGDCRCPAHSIADGAAEDDASFLRDMPSGFLEANLLGTQSAGAFLQSQVQRRGARPGVGCTCSSGTQALEAGIGGCADRTDDWCDESGMEGRSDLSQPQGQICPPANQVCSLPGQSFGHGEAGWVCDGASLESGAATIARVEPGGMRPSYQSRRDRQRAAEPDAVRDECGPQEIRAWAGHKAALVRIVPVHYTGKVWCLRVPTGAFVAVRNGVAFPTGNSGFPKSHNAGNGWATSLKPAWEPICLARKPLSEKNIAANVLAHGTGAINVDGCRVGTGGGTRTVVGTPTDAIHAYNNGLGVGVGGRVEALDCGRWPANVIHDGSDEVIAAFPDTGASKASDRGLRHNGRHGGLSDIGSNLKEGTDGTRGHDDNGGSAARFFYSAKADKEDRFGSKHPTVKPVDLMQWLVRLVTPKGGTVLDPFAGTGTTGEAAIREGMNCILIEREEEYLKDIRTRLTLAEAGPVARQVGRVKNSGKVQEAGPLFGGAA